MEKNITVNAYAKINLSLDVVERMDNGYHRIETVMQQIDLADDIIIESHGNAGLYKGYHIKLESDHKSLPEPEDNLAYKAAKLMAEMFCPFKDNKLVIKLNKKIPMAAGLAGGSSDAAAVMLGLCSMWDISIELKDLCEIGKTLGADIPFCIIGNAANNPSLGFSDDKLASSAALAEGIGEILTPVPSLAGWVVLVKPDISVPTPFVYQQLSTYDALPEQGGNIDRPDTNTLISDIKSQNTKHIVKNMINVLETVSLKEYPIVVYTKNKIGETCGADTVLMSGSGPTVFAYYECEETALKGYTTSMDVLISASGYKYEVYLAKLL